MLVTPICPHTLSFRPVVLPCGVELKIQVPSSSRQVVSVAFDGRNRRQLDPGDYIIINVCNHIFPGITYKQ
jgi:NAD+ kinase